MESQMTPQQKQSALLQLEQIADLDIPLSHDIDIPTYINNHFPTDAHLSDALPSFLSQIDAALHTLDSKLAILVRDHSHDTEATNHLLTSTESSLEGLHTTLATLTTASEAAQRDISAALTPADPIFTALQNTTATADALDALATLDEAVQKLESAATSNLDAIATNLHVFSTIHDSLKRLPTDSSLRRLPQLRVRASVATETVRTKLLADFRRLSDVLASPTVTAAKTDEAVSRLTTVCLVADKMGPDVRAELVGTFVRARRTAFRAAFEMDTSGFSGIERRFSWIRKELRSNWSRLGGERVERGWGRVFPDDWRVARRIADGFMQETRDWTTKTLDAGADRDVAVMVSALGKTKDFEAELERRYLAIGEDAPFVGVVSESFGPWMGAYVDQEDAHLQAVLAELLREETWTGQDGTVLRSATELFLVIKKAMRTCASLDIRQPLFSLHRVFRKHLTAYANGLVKHLPGVFGNALSDSTNPKDFEQKLSRACIIVTTAEYCSSTVQQLEQGLRETVQEVYSSDIDMHSVEEKFSTVAAKGIQSVVALLDEDLEIDLRKISSMNWATWSEVGDTNKHVVQVEEKLTRSTKKLSGQLPKHHFRFLLEKLAASFVIRYRGHIYKCDQMNNFGAQQMLLDTSAVKAMLLGLPATVHVPVPGTYVRYLNREIGKIEAVLKVILAPLSTCVETYVALVPDGSAEDLQSILEMRGLRRADAAPLVLDYARRKGPAQRLKSSQQSKRISREQSPGADGTSGGSDKRTEREGQAEATESKDPTDAQNATSNAQNAAVDSMKNLFGRLGSSFKDAGIADRFEQVSSQFESTTDRLKKEAAARGFRFG